MLPKKCNWLDTINKIFGIMEVFPFGLEEGISRGYFKELYNIEVLTNIITAFLCELPSWC